jgi:hypothetical protein
VPTQVPRRLGRVGRILRLAQPGYMRVRWFERRLTRAATRIGADLIYPMSPRDLDTAKAVAVGEQAIFRQPSWPSAGPRDIVDLAPTRLEFSSSPAGPPLPFHTPDDHRRGRTPEPGRHAGMRIAFAYRRSDTTPAQYLESAAERAGIKVERFDGAIDWANVHPDTTAVVFVESPYPAVEITGSNERGIPVLFWVHHGEHHLSANLRLARHFGAHAILMAHSWHLAHRFSVPVHRFPFAVAPEICVAGHPFRERSRDISMIGAGVEGAGGRYARRQQLVAALKRLYPHTSSFQSGVLPDEMARLYADSRIVLNEGGDRHHPVTMRVFEATGAGAFLLTDDAPGLGLLFDRDLHYTQIEDDIESQVAALLADPETEGKATAAHQHAIDNHLYDHRIDDLLAIAAATKVFAHEDVPASSGIAALIEEDLDVQEIALFGMSQLRSDLEPYVLWDGPTLLSTMRGHTVDAVVLGSAYHGRIDVPAERATRFIYAAQKHHRELERFVQRRWPDAKASVSDGIMRVDLLATSYRARSRFGGMPEAGA